MTTITSLPIPTGTLHAFAGATAPLGYLMCDGTAVSRTTYASLYAVILTTYGAGDGSTTFNLPDLRGRVPVGAGTDGAAQNTYNPVRGAKFGDYRTPSHSHTGTTGYMNQNWAHGHAVEGPGGHSHGVWFGGVGGSVTFSFAPAAVNNGAYGSQRDAVTTTDTNHTHSFTTDNAGTGGSQNQPPSVGVNYIIKF